VFNQPKLIKYYSSIKFKIEDNNHSAWTSW